MGLYEYIREQAHRNDLVGELGRRMSENYGQRPDHNSFAFELASQEFAACKNWTRKDALERLNENERFRQIAKLEPRISEIVSDVLKLTTCKGYNRDNEYSDIKGRISELVGYFAQNAELRDSTTYEVVMHGITDLLPPDVSDLYPDGYPQDVDLDV